MTPLSSDSALLEPAKIQVQLLARQVLHLVHAIKQHGIQIEARFALHCDAAIWQGFRGVRAASPFSPWRRANRLAASRGFALDCEL